MIWRIPELSFPCPRRLHSCCRCRSVPCSHPRCFPRLRSRSRLSSRLSSRRPRPVFSSSVPIPVPVPVTAPSQRPSLSPSLSPLLSPSPSPPPFPSASPFSSSSRPRHTTTLVPSSFASFRPPNLIPPNLGTIRLYRHRALRTELLAACKLHSLPTAETMSRAELKFLLQNNKNKIATKDVQVPTATVPSAGCWNSSECISGLYSASDQTRQIHAHV